MKETPELFELIKKGKVDLKATLPKEENTPSEPSVSQPTPVTVQPKPGSVKPYPKWRMPFGKPVATVAKGEKTLALKYNVGILIIILVVLGIILAFVFGTRLGKDQLQNTGQPSEISGTTEPSINAPTNTPTTVPATPTEPTKNKRIWFIRLIYYGDDTAGRASANNMIKWLKDKNITDASIEKERISGGKRVAIYTGSFDSREEAVRQLEKYRRLHSAFRRCDVVEKQQ